MKGIDFSRLPGWVAVPLGIIMFLGGWLLAIVALLVVVGLIGQIAIWWF